ncbi:CbtA family protein [Alphaproteobacteria bacterium]|nr:cobalt transporter [Alphaproteobacteria bacterium]MDA9815816.1 CbtA family protein [Alphaproteobacteria bacterium]
MFSRIMVSGLFAGAIAGIIAGFLQWYFVQPVLLHSELYETGILTHFDGSSNSAHPDLEYIQPMRDGLSLIFSMLIYTGYALILIAAMTLRQQKSETTITFHQGIIWGVSGFFVMHLAPAISLPPEVPGAAAAELQPRQIWWFATTLLTAGGLWIIAFTEKVSSFIIGAALILVPHIFGAPEPDIFTGPAPTEIGALFASRALGVGLISWAILGVLSAFFLQKETLRATS